MCTVPAADRDRLALAARSIPGVVNVRVLMAGRRDLHVVAVGEDTEDLREIARSLSELDIRIEDEELLQTEIRSAYEPFAPDDSSRSPGPTEVVTLPDGIDVVEVTVSAAAPIAGQSLGAAREEGVLDEEVVVVSLERDGEIRLPNDDTVVRADDIATVLPRGSDTEAILSVFSNDPAAE
jgi:hypothetical protein